MSMMLVVLDTAILALFFASAWFWFRASRNRVRRVARDEVLDYADINRIVVAINRSQFLNSRAALTTAFAGLLAFTRLLIDVGQISGP